MAECRLVSLRRRFLRDSGLKATYSQVIEDYIRKDMLNLHRFQASRSNVVSPAPRSHAPQKPGNIRVVYDCESKSRGVSLNDHLLQGPDFVNDQVGVLIRFRQEPVALCGDI